MSAKSSIELLKAQAVIARSWVLAQIARSEQLKETSETHETSLEFKDELSPLVHIDETSANSCQIIDHLTQQVQRQWASRNNKQENADIKC